eukprot:m.77324 g.77324  ORF g.77324 m.77324 type:complete len:690 (-) comp14462_c0_seq1:72-2141(-)
MMLSRKILVLGAILQAVASDVVPTYFKRRLSNGSLVDGLQQLRHQASLIPDHSRRLQADAELSVTPTSLSNDEPITISWHGVKDPLSNDWIGLFCPPSAPNTNYMDYFFVNTVDTYDKGFGNVTQAMGVMRGDCEFRYLVNNSYTAIATSQRISWNQTTPYHMHLSLTGQVDEMRVMWVANTNTAARVHYGTSPDALDQTASSSHKSWTYAASDMCGPPANTTGFVDPGYMHSVIVAALKPKTRYYYLIQQTGSDNTSVMSFVSSPETKADYTFQFVAYADMGIVGGAQATADASLHEVTVNGAEMIVHPGDISYARGAAHIWDTWMAMIEPYATKVPYMVGIGNHEYDHTTGGDKDPSNATGTGFHPAWGDFGDDSDGECGVPMYQRFKMPDNGNSLFWYSYDYGSVHFIMMSSEHDCSKGSQQYTWLERDLNTVDRSKTPWVVLMAHRPMYSSETYLGDYEVAVGMQHEFEDLIYQKVDLALYGHYHSHERTCPVYRNKCQPPGEAPVHIVIGSAGASLDGDGLYDKNWSMFFDNDFGYGRVTVANTTAMHWEYVRTKDNRTVNDAWIYKAGVPEATVTTVNGCKCQQPWENDGHSYYNCWNPDGEAKNWCYVQGTDCGTPGADNQHWDFCDTPVLTTKHNCTCQTPFNYGGLRYYGCTDADVDAGQSWCYVGGECGTSGASYWDYC